LEFNVPFQQKYSYIRGAESYPYPIKEVQRYINLNPGRLFVQQPPKKEKGSRGISKLGCTELTLVDAGAKIRIRLH